MWVCVCLFVCVLMGCVFLCYSLKLCMFYLPPPPSSHISVSCGSWEECLSKSKQKGRVGLRCVWEGGLIFSLVSASLKTVPVIMAVVSHRIMGLTGSGDRDYYCEWSLSDLVYVWHSEVCCVYLCLMWFTLLQCPIIELKLWFVFVWMCVLECVCVHSQACT